MRTRIPQAEHQRSVRWHEACLTSGRMRRLKRLGLVLLTLLLGAFALSGVLSMTRGTPVEIVISEGPLGPPSIGDSLFEQMFELYTGTHIGGGNAVEQM